MSRNVKELEEKIGLQFQGQPFAQTHAVDATALM